MVTSNSKPRSGGLTNKQHAALAAAAPLGAAIVAKMRAAYLAQPRGGGGGGGPQQTRPPTRRRRAGVPLRMPPNLLWQERGGRTDFTGQTTKALQRQAWTADPATSNMMAPRGLGYYDAFATMSDSAMTHLSIGPATPIVAKTTCLDNGSPISTKWKYSAQLLVVGPAPGSTQAVLYRESSGTPTDKVDLIAYDSTQLLSDPPAEMIPTRCSVRVRNFTNQYNMGGLVRVLRATTGMFLDPDYTSNAALADLMQGIRDHRRTHTYTGPEFTKAMQKNAIVADQSRSLMFKDCDLIAQAGQLPWFESHYGPPAVLPSPTPGAPPAVYDPTKPVYDFTDYIANPTFTPLLILFEPYSQDGGAQTAGGPNTYEVIVQSQFFGHYKQGTMLANMAIEPKSNHGALDRHRNAEERKGSLMETVGKGLANVGHWAWEHRGDLLTAGALML